MFGFGTEDGQAGDDLIGPGKQGGQHSAGIGLVDGFSHDFIFMDDNGIGADDDGSGMFFEEGFFFEISDGCGSGGGGGFFRGC